MEDIIIDDYLSKNILHIAIALNLTMIRLIFWTPETASSYFLSCFLTLVLNFRLAQSLNEAAIYDLITIIGMQNPNSLIVNLPELAITLLVFGIFRLTEYQV